MKLFLLVSLLIQARPLKGLHFWKHLEFLNDLHNNLKVFSPLPSKKELNKLQQYNYIKQVNIPLSQATIYPNNSCSLQKFIFGNKLNFFIHPHPKAEKQFEKYISSETENISAISSSSARSFFVDDFIVKLSLPLKIGELDRSLYELQMKRAINISNLLDQSSLKNHLREVLAITPHSDCPFGFIIREIPQDILCNKKSYAPLFSFVYNLKNSLLRYNAIQRQLTSNDYAQEILVPILVQSFFNTFSQTGIILEAHQQNTLLELDEDNIFTGKVIYRDLDGGRISIKYRTDSQLPLDFLNQFSNQHQEWIFSKSEYSKDWIPVLRNTYKVFVQDCSLELLDWTLKNSNQNCQKRGKEIFEQMLKNAH